MKWNYRIVQTESGTVGVFAVYYFKKSNISRALIAIGFQDEDIEDLLHEQDLIALAYKKDILDEQTNFKSISLEEFQKAKTNSNKQKTETMSKEISWDYRVIKKDNGTKAVHYVYYNKKKKPIMRSKESAKLESWDLESLIKKQELIYQAFHKDILVEKINKKGKWSLKKYQ